jgi:DNA-binding transcriptional regulator YiaG
MFPYLASACFSFERQGTHLSMKGDLRVDRKEFTAIRRYLGKTQNQMAQLLGTSLKAMQSFEQGWRKVPVHIERQLLFMVAQKFSASKGKKQKCWTVQSCSKQNRANCPAWEFQLGHLCWFINGTVCHGQVQESWHKKMKTCRKCDVFGSLMPEFLARSAFN